MFSRAYKITKTDQPGALADLGEAIKPLKEKLSESSVKITATDEDPYTFTIFPDGICVRDVKDPRKMEALLQLLLESRPLRDADFSSFKIDQAFSMLSHHIYVCTHMARDKRCGDKGPPIVTQFRRRLLECGLNPRVRVQSCSHLGGHKFAGNVIIFGADASSGGVVGDWYGYVSEKDVDRLIERHLLKNEVVTELWRGRMGLSPADQEEFVRRQETCTWASSDSASCGTCCCRS